MDFVGPLNQGNKDLRIAEICAEKLGRFWLQSRRAAAVKAVSAPRKSGNLCLGRPSFGRSKDPSPRGAGPAYRKPPPFGGQEFPFRIKRYGLGPRRNILDNLGPASESTKKIRPMQTS